MKQIIFIISSLFIINSVSSQKITPLDNKSKWGVYTETLHSSTYGLDSAGKLAFFSFQGNQKELMVRDSLKTIRILLDGMAWYKLRANNNFAASVRQLDLYSAAFEVLRYIDKEGNIADIDGFKAALKRFNEL